MAKKRITLNDEDRREWVSNCAYLYGWWKSTGQGLYRFVRENREELSKIILRYLGEVPQ